jgi:2-octaprenyl-6-methoxyphenol hydroxylase
MHKYDIVIVGGGLNGMLAAIMFGNSPNKVLLLDSAPEPKDIRINKAIVLNHSSVQFLESLGLVFPNDDYYEITNCNVSAKGHFGRVRMSSGDIDLPYLGRVVSYKLLHNLVFSLLKKIKNVTAVYSSLLTNVNYDSMELEYTTENKTFKLVTSFILGADGVGSKCRSLANIEHNHYDLDYSSLVLNVSTCNNNNLALQRFILPGSVATIPTGDSSSCVVWTMPTKIINSRIDLPESQLLSLAKSEIGKGASNIIDIIDKPISYPVKLSKSSKASISGLVLLGAAAINLLPITAQGLNISIRDLQCLRSLMSKSKNIKWDNNYAIKYNKLRQQDHDFCYQQVKLLQKTFTTKNFIYNTARSFALNAISLNPFVGEFIAIRGAGYFNYGSFDIEGDTNE